MEQLGSHLTDFDETWHLSFSGKSVEKIHSTFLLSPYQLLSLPLGVHTETFSNRIAVEILLRIYYIVPSLSSIFI